MTNLAVAVHARDRGDEDQHGYAQVGQDRMGSDRACRLGQERKGILG